ncbi:hypothetical protein Tco_1112398, partial [Tanacetum coccineum]
ATAFPLSVPLHKSKTLKKDPFPKPSRYNVEVSDFLPMDLFSFIHHAEPTKVRMGEMEKAGDQVPLLEATRGRVVPLAPPILVTEASSEGNMTKSIDMLFNEGSGADKEHSIGGGEYVALTKAIVEPIIEDVAENPRSTCGKSHTAMQSLLDSSKLAAEIGVMATATMPLVTSFVTPTPKREGGDHTDSVSGPNLRTKPAAVRFVISSDSSHHSGTHDADVEVSSLVRSTILDPPVMTAAVTTTVVVVVEIPPVLVPKVTVMPVNPTLFRDSMSTSRHDVTGPSSPIHPELSADSFYAIKDLNPETLHRVYVPKWTVTNESVLDDPYRCRTLTDQLAPPALFSQLYAMKEKHTLRKKKILEEECAQQTNLLKEKNAKIASLKSRLSLKKAEATEAIRLRDCVATVEATEALHATELNHLKERNSTLEAKMRASKEKVAVLESEKSGLTDQVSSLETTCAKLRNQVVGYEFFKEQIAAVQDRSKSLLRRLWK